MQYNSREIELKWQKAWADQQSYKVEVDHKKPKFYVLDMFPYPSGAGLHVGHPLGYIASDIFARYKRNRGFNVLHPMGYDAFGLPAEQYAIQTGQHPAITTDKNLERYTEQLSLMGFSFDWDRKVKTCDPIYYKWTQWIFMQLFGSWYDQKDQKAKPIEELIAQFSQNGSKNIFAACDEETAEITAEQWNNFSDKEQQTYLLQFRLTYLADTFVNWCPELGTVLANDEVKDGLSERGGYPVERRKMKQWMMRITAYADRLEKNMEHLDWSDSLKEMQRNWIGKSHGGELTFKVADQDMDLTVFTTRADTIFGVTYVVIAPEHEWVDQLIKSEQAEEAKKYINWAKNRSERERMSEAKKVTGVFSGSYVVNPFNGEKVPLWIGDYVIASYGTGVVMAVPSSDDRDFKFASNFNLPIIPVIEGTEGLENPTDKKKGKMINSGFLNGKKTSDAIVAAIEYAEQSGFGKSKVNYRIRDAVFSRQRYWGEPVPVYFKEGIPYPIKESELPLDLPKVDEYKPTSEGEPPLGRAKDWKYQDEYEYELTTMPGWAGSSWYFLRYMDAANAEQFVGEEAVKYWNQVDLYVGGTEHATGHLLYSRFWNMFLFDRGHVFHEEPFKKLVNQGMVQGRSNMVYKLKSENTFVSLGLKDQYNVIELHTDVNLTKNDVLDVDAFKKWRPEYVDAKFILEDGQYKCGVVVEKMSKSKWNTVNPDEIIEKYGADTFRMYEMFLGPIELSKPWNTNGIDGVAKFLKKLWQLFVQGEKIQVSEEKADVNELKVLHETIKKVQTDIENLSFNTSVSQFMICVNELTKLKCNKREVLEPLLIVLSPFAPHITEELYQITGGNGSILDAGYPEFKEAYLVEANHEYPIMINGKMRTKIQFPSGAAQADIQAKVLENDVVLKWTEGKPPKKVIVVPKKIVNIVL